MAQVNSGVNTMRPEKIISALAVTIGIGLFVAAIDSALDYRRAVRAGDWHSVSGKVIKRTDFTSPAFRCFMPRERYSEIEYRYEDENGRTIRGFAQAPRASEIYESAVIRVRFDPAQPAHSLPELSIDAYRTAYGLTAILGFFSAFGMAWVAQRLRRNLGNGDTFQTVSH